jgi:isoleucyl-tRNA synthetase
MHKSWGNAIWFDEAVEIMGADIMRWMYAGANITQNMNFGYGLADEVKRNLMTLWNSYSFFVMYANLDGFNPAESTVPVAQRSELDRWILARLHELTRLAREELGSFDVAALTRHVDAFVDDLSNWYIRRSRRRFWKSESDSDKLGAYSTLYEVLVTLAKLIAPVMPFLAEHLYQNLVRSNGASTSQPESVHHCSYPEVDEALIDRQLLSDVALTQRVVSLGRAARNKANVKVRQPLRRMVVRAPSKADEVSLKRIEAQVTEELNVKSMVVTSEVGELITYVIKPNFALLGPKYGNRLGAIRVALTAADPTVLAAQVEAGRMISLTLDGGDTVELLPEEVQVDTREREGFAVTQDSGLVVALDTELDEELLREGIARDVVRIINDMRKSADFDVSDRIRTSYQVSQDGKQAQLVEAALRQFADYISTETLSSSLAAEDAGEGAFTQQEELGDAKLVLAIQRV